MPSEFEKRIATKNAKKAKRRTSPWYQFVVPFEFRFSSAGVDVIRKGARQNGQGKGHEPQERWHCESVIACRCLAGGGVMGSGDCRAYSRSPEVDQGVSMNEFAPLSSWCCSPGVVAVSGEDQVGVLGCWCSAPRDASSGLMTEITPQFQDSLRALTPIIRGAPLGHLRCDSLSLPAGRRHAAFVHARPRPPSNDKRGVVPWIRYSIAAARSGSLLATAYSITISEAR
ncbi:hypothetical protein K438DRAFT_1762283 [Mycena galopus ATCC 62051]|nr:hypothetical protein K438DRAFT_1762283 [Mycena galopus ATCC 62051]